MEQSGVYIVKQQPSSPHDAAVAAAASVSHSQQTAAATDSVITPSPADQLELMQVMRALQKYNMKDAEEAFKREMTRRLQPGSADKEVYFDVYDSLRQFVEQAKDHKVSRRTSP